MLPFPDIRANCPPQSGNGDGSDNWPCWHEGVLEIGLVQVGESIEENSRRVVGTLEPSDAFLGH